MEKSLRMLAVLGPIAVLIVDLVLDGTWEWRQGYAAFVLVLTLLAVVVALFWLLPQEVKRLKQCADLLVPLGLYVLATAVLGWCLLLPLVAGVLQPSWDLTALSISFSLSASLLAVVFLAVAFAAWTLGLICLATEGQPVELTKGLELMRRGFWRMLGYMTLTMVAFFLLLGVALAVAPLSIGLAMVFICGETVLLNFATAGLLLRGMARPEVPFWTCLREGLSVSLLNARRWWLPLLLQMELLGLFTYVHLTTSRAWNPRVVSNLSVNGMWTGGFERDSRWLSAVMEAAETSAPLVVATLLGLALGLFAVAVKLRVARELHEIGELSQAALGVDD